MFFNRKKMAEKLRIARSTLYYESKKEEKDEEEKLKIQEIMDSNPSYGHRRIALALSCNKKKALRLMNKFGLKPKISRNRRWIKKGDLKLPEAIYKNEIVGTEINEPDIAWTADFTYIRYKTSFIYLATILDIFTKEIIGFSISKWHNGYLVKSAIDDAIRKRGRLPRYLHTDQGSEYRAEIHADYLISLGVIVSMSQKSSPWQNGEQESFYSQFKLELGNVNRFESEGELCEAIYRQIYYYNHFRIHTAIKMAPVRFYELAVSGRN